MAARHHGLAKRAAGERLGAFLSAFGWAVTVARPHFVRRLFNQSNISIRGLLLFLQPGRA
jgi:hypothetical protein